MLRTANVIRELENQALRSADLPAPTGAALETYKIDGEQLREWLAEVTKVGAASFLEAQNYFVPVPVALFVCESGLLSETLAPVGGAA